MTTPTDAMRVGLEASYRAVVTAEAVRAFAHITGDDAAHHLDAEYAQQSALGRPVAHGVLLLGYVSTASTRLLEDIAGHFVSIGYEAVRFRRPLYVGDSATVTYRITEFMDPRSTAEFSVSAGDGTVCALGRHLMQRIDD